MKATLEKALLSRRDDFEAAAVLKFRVCGTNGKILK
jgi:hypothetical protein